MKKTSIALCMAATVMMSGVAGFGGATFAFRMHDQSLDGTVSVAQTGDAKLLSVSFVDNDAPDVPMVTETEPTDNLLVTEWPDETLIQTAAFTENVNMSALTIPQIASSVSDSVVEIATEQVMNSNRLGQYVQSGAGSGVIISADGYIVTNNHVIERASKITVRLKNGSTYTAQLIGRDVKTDLAVIKIEASGLRTARYGYSDQLVVGELAVAIGNPLGELGGTVTEGIISALNRDIDIEGEMMNLMQISAAVNPGNSGGGLFNSYGELIGVVNAKSNGSNIEGIGFAIPINTVKAVVNQLIQNGFVAGRVDFGISMLDVQDVFTAMRYGVSAYGVYVAKTDAESGLQAGDRIVSVNGMEVSFAADVKAIYDQCKVGEQLNLIIIRNGKSYKAEVTLMQAKN